jgi:outer membrane immunogenic protein
MKTLITFSLILLSPAAAFGADLLGKSPGVLRAPSASTAPSNSTGFYVGLNVGGGFGNVDISGLANQANANSTIVDTRLTRSGPLGGVQAGFSAQSGPLVYGVEADMDFGALRGTLSTTGLVTTPGATPTASPTRTSFNGKVESRFNSLGTLRARVGYAFDNVLVYGTGGYATAHHDAKATLEADGVPQLGTSPTPAAGISLGSVSVHQWVNGWTLGAGSELAFSPNVSLKLEYLYAQVSNKVAGQNLTHSLNLVRTGVNYRF